MVYAKLYEVTNAKKRIAELLDIFQLTNLKNKSTRDLSTGQRARANLCKALLNKPKLLLLETQTLASFLLGGMILWVIFEKVSTHYKFN